MQVEWEMPWHRGWLQRRPGVFGECEETGGKKPQKAGSTGHDQRGCTG